MATCNFGDSIFSKIYAVNTDDCDEYNDVRESVQMALASLPGGYKDDHRDNIAHVYADVELCGVPFELRLDVQMKSGYYSGGYFDGCLFIDGEEYDFNYIDESECASMIEAGLWQTDQACNWKNCGAVTGFAKIQGKNLLRRIEKAYNDLLQTVEGVIAPYTDHVRRVATFSNGAAIYERIA